jgi:hypothetical protein
MTSFLLSTGTFLHGLAFAFAAASVLYVFVFAVASRFGPRAPHAGSPSSAAPPDAWPSLAVLLPAYREDAVIVDTARRAAQHNYPGRFEVIVIADSLRLSTLRSLKALPVTLIQVDFEESTKARAINATLNRMATDRYDAVTVLDADNVMAPGCLEALARALAGGARSVQGRRVAKNVGSTWALVDGVSEAINNALFRRGHAALGLSAALIGSGLAIETDLFRRLMAEIDTPTGFDKDLEMRLTRRGILTAYAPGAVVYDEKVTGSDQFVQQRSRWMGAQGRYLRTSLRSGLRALRRGGPIDHVDKVVQTALPPRGLLLGTLPLVAVAAALAGALGTPGAFTWAAGWAGLTGILILALALALPRDRPDLQVTGALRALPAALACAFSALLLSPRALVPNTRTEHHSVGAPRSAPSARKAENACEAEDACDLPLAADAASRTGA